MAYENLLYEGVFTLFGGFLIFISIILNRIHKFLAALDTYFVLFLFTGILMSLIGTFLMVSWTFKIRGPYIGARAEEKHPFVTFFAVGNIMIVLSLTGIYYFNSAGYMTMVFRIFSILGILLLSVGLIFFYGELLKIIKTTQKRSGTSALHNRPG